MNQARLEDCGLEVVRDLGRGSYGLVRLMYVRQKEQFVVQKEFVLVGNQEAINKRYKEAQAEAKMLRRIKHKNIVSVFGTRKTENASVGIIMEYAPCGDLETLLLNELHIPISWKIRSRFFAELADALDYLHNHDPKRSYIHGDLKPQNVLLADNLTIKLADFGAATIATRTGATTLTIDSNKTNQHTPIYTAPEYLRDPKGDRHCSMDVYSYGLIGYETVTRKNAYSGNQVNLDVVIYKIQTEGQKPDTTHLDEIARTLEDNPNESVIFYELQAIIYQCWQFKPEARPKISEVKQNLHQLVQNQQVYCEDTAKQVSLLIEQRKLKPQLPVMEKQNRTEAVRLWMTRNVLNLCKLWIIFAMIAAVVATLVANYRSQPQLPNNFIEKKDWHVEDSALFNSWEDQAPMGMMIKPEPLDFLNSPCIFSALKRRRSCVTFSFCDIIHSTICSRNTIISCTDKINFLRSFGIVIINRTVYIFENNRDYRKIPHTTYKLNFSMSIPKAPEKLVWENKYYNKKYIAFGDSIIAAGKQQYIISHNSSTNLRKEAETSNVFRYDATVDEWFDLPDTNDPRSGCTLVEYQGRVCAVGGFLLSSVECYNVTTNKWTNLPQMKARRREAAAVELAGELYVIGGIYESFISEKKTVTHILKSVEKYDQITKSWTKVGSLLEQRLRPIAAVCYGKIYVLSKDSYIIEAYDPSDNTWKYVKPFEGSFKETHYISLIPNSNFRKKRFRRKHSVST